MGGAGDDDDGDDECGCCRRVSGIFDETGSAVQLGILGAVQLLQMPVVIYGGALADVVNRKVLMAITQSVSFISLVILTYLAFSEVMAPWHIWVVTGATGMVNMLGSSARPAMLPRVVPRSHLTNAVTISTSTMQSRRSRFRSFSVHCTSVTALVPPCW